MTKVERITMPSELATSASMEGATVGGGLTSAMLLGSAATNERRKSTARMRIVIVDECTAMGVKSLECGMRKRVASLLYELASVLLVAFSGAFSCLKELSAVQSHPARLSRIETGGARFSAQAIVPTSKLCR